MGIDPPFIYDKASSYTFAGPTHRAFDPRAATRASWSPTPPKPKKEGPLIDFNKHPDSYLIVPYGNLNVEPMSPKTKARVKRSRRFQLFLRILCLIGSLGLLFCVIAINKTSTPVGWIIRVGPAVALCHCVYAIHHLCRDAAGRSPASTASYMLFAALIDTGLIPFFAFSAVMANAEYQTNAYNWSTLFGDGDITHQIIHAFFLACIAEGGLVVVSLIMDIYLAKVFRRIAKMPPDMNPLEDNLTARPNGKHKRNKSSVVFEKHLSGSTLATQRMSQFSNDSVSNFKRVPYTHTRTDSADSITLYGNDKALNSRMSLRSEMKEDSADPYRNSMTSSRDNNLVPRPLSAMTPPANARAPGAGLDHKPVRSSALAQDESNGRPAWLSYTDRSGTPSMLSEVANQQLDGEVRPLSPVSMLSERDFAMERAQAERQNWYSNSPRNSAQMAQPEVQLTHRNISTDSVDRLGMYQEDHIPPLIQQPKKRSRDPLGMNPPTPIQDRYQDENLDQPAAQSFLTPQRPALQNIHVNSSDRPGMGSRPSSFIGSGGKLRFYGDLRNSLGGSPTRESFDSPTTQNFHDDGSDDYPRTKTMQSEDSGNFEVYGSEDESDLEDHQRQLQDDERNYSDIDRQTHAIMLGVSQHQDQWNGVRKTSNSTGLDLKGGYAGLGAEFGKGMARRREVSGKVAEEGRGGITPEELTPSQARIESAGAGQAQRLAAAGWARFHGR